MTENTRRYDRFDYFEEDTACIYCLYCHGKKRGCERKKCCCDDIRTDAVANGRIKRERGWNKR